MENLVTTPIGGSSISLQEKYFTFKASENAPNAMDEVDVNGEVLTLMDAQRGLFAEAALAGSNRARVRETDYAALTGRVNQIAEDVVAEVGGMGPFSEFLSMVIEVTKLEAVELLSERGDAEVEGEVRDTLRAMYNGVIQFMQNPDPADQAIIDYYTVLLEAVQQRAAHREKLISDNRFCSY